MNWITKALNFGEKIKKAFKRRATKEELEPKGKKIIEVYFIKKIWEF